MIFNVGHKVKINKKVCLRRHEEHIWDSGAMKIVTSNKIVTITEIDERDNTYKIDLDDGDFWWYEDELLPIYHIDLDEDMFTL